MTPAGPETSGIGQSDCYRDGRDPPLSAYLAAFFSAGSSLMLSESSAPSRSPGS